MIFKLVDSLLEFIWNLKKTEKKITFFKFQAAAVLESEPIQHTAQMQEVVNNMQAAAAEVKVEADAVSITAWCK